jgi:hypothetical protein
VVLHHIAQGANFSANKALLERSGRIALGTDFPVEDVSPFKTFHSAVARTDSDEFPEGGYLPQNKLSRSEALSGMTIWGAYANFEEKEKGSIEVGKMADFVILDRDLTKVTPQYAESPVAVALCLR